jgi:hypothetical protein
MDSVIEANPTGSRNREWRIQMINFSTNQPVNKRLRVESLGVRQSPLRGQSGWARGKGISTSETLAMLGAVRVGEGQGV